MTKEDILRGCKTNPQGFHVTLDEIKSAFPTLLPLNDNKDFHDFLIENHLSFTLPDFVFKKSS